MPPRFRPGAAAYAKDGRRYTVEEVEGGIVYCASESGAEAEFPEAQLMTATEWAGRSGGRPEMLYGQIKQARDYAPYRGPLARAEAEALLAKAERLHPGLLDFAAFTVARRAVEAGGNADFVAELSIKKCRAIFEAAAPPIRASILAGLLGAPADRLASAARLGDNLLRAMIDKGLAEGGGGFDEFHARRRQ
jgi:hypothetical protein